MVMMVMVHDTIELPPGAPPPPLVHAPNSYGGVCMVVVYVCACA